MPQKLYPISSCLFAEARIFSLCTSWTVTEYTLLHLTWSTTKIKTQKFLSHTGEGYNELETRLSVDWNLYKAAQKQYFIDVNDSEVLDYSVP